MPKLRARQWPHPVSRLKAKTPLCRPRSDGKGAAHKSTCAQKTLKPCKCSGARAADIPTAPRRDRRGLWGYAPACCGRLHESVPSSTLAVRCLYVTKDGSPARHPTLQWSFHATPQARGCLLRQGRFHLVAGRCPCPCQGASRCSPSRGDVELAMSPLGSGRPVRPCLVVNPGGGAAAPWTSWPQPSSENNFPCATRPLHNLADHPAEARIMLILSRFA